MSTRMDSCANFSYMFLNLVGEVGELASKVAKLIRKEHAQIDDNDFNLHIYDYDNEGGRIPLPVKNSLHELKLEAGDILWQLAGLCHDFGWSLEDVAQANLDKLALRKAAGTIDGNGDGVTKEERSR